MISILLIAFTSCSSKPKIQEFPKSADAKEEIFNLKMDLRGAEQEDLALLAPHSFEDAEDSLSDAQEKEKKGKSNERVLSEVALGRAYLERARERAQNAQKKMPDILAAREAARVAQADTMLSSKFNKLDKQITEETSKLEKNKDTDIKEIRSQLIAGYLDLELRAIKQTHLGTSKKLIDTAVTNGARNLVPTTLSQVNEKYQDADLFITKNRHSKREIEEKSVALETSAKELMKTAMVARGVSKVSTEETALRIQAEEERIKSTESALTEEEKINASLATSNERLKKTNNLNSIYEEARRKFSPDEAEVYKQGKSLVIRMRGIQFPQSEAVLRGDNFALLKKVDDVIESFEQSKVSVQGHTDSSGGQAQNQKLSALRAQAVKQYLEANVDSERVSFDSQGFGFQKPLASNKTPQGRAENRRVDVIITPAQL